ncbi:M48 family metalloprotease [Tenacibaculum ovolyticum]|uniref:hypothetical protein n=1 Tax=Tenacibaculum ovolyticum TaxID=104270 RepID=UPI0004123DAE|nr:hypothetical protein [Tenacibaculum ovolyticum]
MKNLIILLIFIAFSCESSSIKKDEIPIDLTEEETLKKLFSKTIKPLFKTYKDVVIPNDFRIDEEDNSINAGAADNYLEVSKGLVNSKKEYIQVFVLAHEISHIVTLNQANTFMLSESIPSGVVTNDYKKAEYLADLIAIHLINIHEKELSEILESNFETLKDLLGNKTFTHPGGNERVNLMKKYLTKEKNDNSSNAFKEVFEEIWSMN